MRKQIFVAQHLQNLRESEVVRIAPHESDATEDLEDQPFEEIWNDTSDSIREGVAFAEPYAGTDFTVVGRSGTWTTLNRGVLESDRVIAQAKQGLPTTFCQIYKLSKMPSFSYSRYGYDGATQLARELCRKMQFFFNIWKAQPD